MAQVQEIDVKKEQALKGLLELGKKKGSLTLKEMSDALVDINLDSDELDALYSAEAMDISTDIEVLDSILKSQNLAK